MHTVSSSATTTSSLGVTEWRDESRNQPDHLDGIDDNSDIVASATPVTPTGVKKKALSKKTTSPSSEHQRTKGRSKPLTSSSHNATTTGSRDDPLTPSSSRKASSRSCHVRRYERPESPAEDLLLDMQRMVERLGRRVQIRIQRAEKSGQKALQASLDRFANGKRLTSTVGSMRKYDAYRRRTAHWGAVKERLDGIFLSLDREMRRARFDNRLGLPFTMDPHVARTFTTELQSLHALVESESLSHDDGDSSRSKIKTDRELVDELQEIYKKEQEEEPLETLSPRKSRHDRMPLREPGTPLSPAKTRRGGKKPGSSHHRTQLPPTIEAL
eukprot:scaffold8471_cov184-Amphora_coffeaeformis.AAC.2